MGKGMGYMHTKPEVDWTNSYRDIAKKVFCACYYGNKSWGKQSIPTILIYNEESHGPHAYQI